MNYPGRESLARVWYPLIIFLTLMLHYILGQSVVSDAAATYLAVLAGATAVTLLEFGYPYNRDWRPETGDVLNDASYMILVQVLLPQFLGYLLALLFIDSMAGQSHFWPRDWPVAIQVMMMILIADFLRYWLHRASHNFLPLWQLHAVHHSPQRLYWLNVGRFHPLEKMLQFLFDALPFILLGIDAVVLSWYFVFYAVNGFFQHSNVHVRLGWLNYLISGPELHRWHHSMKIAESNHNYGNNIILWDLLFGTWYLPERRQVGELGLVNRRYPLSFHDQLKTPFILSLDKQSLPMISWLDILNNLLLSLRLAFLFLGSWSKFILSTRWPFRTQARLLRSILADNRESRFGRDHHFAAISGYRDFIANCPIQTYEDLSVYIDLNGPEHGLTVQPPRLYQLTSATTGAAKYLPMTARGLAGDKLQQNLVALARYLENPATYIGKLFAIVSPAIEGYLESCIPYGSASGLTYQNMPAMARTKYVVPYKVFEIPDYELKYRIIALFAMLEHRVSIAATANPSTLVRILEIINTEFDTLLAMLDPSEPEVIPVDTTIRRAITDLVEQAPDRIEKLKQTYAVNRCLSYRDIWPDLQTVVTWTGGSCGLALSSLKGQLPDKTRIAEMGYLSSEFRGTITLDYVTGVPTLTYNFFEFIERDGWEEGGRQSLLLSELEIGKQYYVIVTTVNGLYRYFMNDIVEVTGRFHRTPTLAFVQKGRGTTSITGEKLYEGQVLTAIRHLEAKLGVNVRFYQCQADEAAAAYILYLEADGLEIPVRDMPAGIFDAQLMKLNIEYKQKRQSGRLKPAVMRMLRRGTGEAFKRFHLMKGQREGQFKALTLVYTRDSLFPFAEYLAD